MMLSAVELAAHELSNLWQKALDVRTETGELIVTGEIEYQINVLDKLVRDKKLFLSDQQKKRIAKAKGLGRHIGGQMKALPHASELMSMLGSKGVTLTSLAKDLNVSRQTIANRIKGA